jgi:dTDP-4-dehydrorhamnose 3,5-epimerase-like enzyme
LSVDRSLIPSLAPSPLADATAPERGIDRCRIIDFPKIEEARGSLTFIEGERHVDFDIKRVYYVYDVPGGADRGGHAHKELHQLLIAMSGSFDVVVDDGVNRQRFHMNRSYYGLYIPPMVWRDINNFSSGSVCMVLASAYYDEADYYRERDDFVKHALA